LTNSWFFYESEEVSIFWASVCSCLENIIYIEQICKSWQFHSMALRIVQKVVFFFINGHCRSRAKRKGFHRKIIFLTNRGTWGEHFPLWKYLSRVYIFLRNTNDSFISLSWSNAFLATRKPILNVMFLKIILQIRKKAFRKIKYQFCFWSYIICYNFLDSLLSYIRLTYKTGYM